MNDLLPPIVVSAGLGMLIGIIRQWGEQTDRPPGDFAGVRTHTLWAVLGCLGAHASTVHVPFAFVAVMILVAAHLVARAATRPESSLPGSTSFAGALLTLFCGALVSWGETKSAILVAATTMVLLGLKQPIHRWTRAITERDIRATLQFAAISGVILPLVPNRDLGPYGAFNPFETWLMVVLISGLGFAGYVSMRLIGARAGILLTAVLGGLASSTATTLAFSRRSREEPGLSAHYTLAVLAACTIMLPRILIVIGVINRGLALSLIVPFALMALPALGYGSWIWFRRRHERREGDTPALGNPLSLGTSIKFALLYSGIALAVTAVREQGWTESLLPLSFVSGLTDMDAISLSLARDDSAELASSELATRAVVLAGVANTLLKAGLGIFLGSPGLRIRLAASLGLTAAVGVGWILLTA